jgi:hypothetical protein
MEIRLVDLMLLENYGKSLISLQVDLTELENE